MIHTCIATQAIDLNQFRLKPCFKSLTRLPNVQLHVAYNNRKPLSVIYNEMTQSLSTLDDDDIILYMHDDVQIQCMDIEETLIEGLSKYDIVGLAGSAHFSLQSPCVWHNSPREAWSGTVSHLQPDKSITVNCFGLYKQVIVLDGLFIAVKVRTLKAYPSLQWATYLKHFHFYDLDYCLQAHSLGLTLGTIHCPVIHHSVGNYNSPDWKQSEIDFINHWK